MDAKSNAELPWLLKLKAPGDKEGAPEASDATTLPTDTLGLALSGGGIEGMAFCLGVLQSLAWAGWLRHVDFLSTVGAGSAIGGLLGRAFCHASQVPGAQGHVAQELVGFRSWSMDWLRKHVGRLAPSGMEKSLAGVPLLVWALVVFGFLVVSVAGLANAIRYYGATGLPNGLAMPAEYEPEFMAGPWLSLAELVFFLAAAPLLIAHVMSSDHGPGTFIAPLFVVAAAIAGVLLVVLQNPLCVVVFAASVLWVVIASTGAGDADVSQGLTRLLLRDRLGRWLCFWLVTVGVLAVLAIVDALAVQLAPWIRDGRWTIFFFAGLGSLLLLIILTPWLDPFRSQSPIRHAASCLTFLIFGALPLLFAGMFISHWAYQTEYGYLLGLGFTIGVMIVSVLLGRRECVQVLNRLDAAARYSSRLACVILGAVNPLRRHHVEASDPAHAVEGDDAALGEYHPEAAGGPLHLINFAIEQSRDPSRAKSDRLAESMAVGGDGSVSGEPLDLALWLALSGAIGECHYWWQAEFEHALRREVPLQGPWAALRRMFAATFQTQSLIWAAVTQQFHAPWLTHLRLTEGRRFEPTGAYELLRRRVPFVIVCDAGGAGSGLRQLIERASVDFGIEIHAIQGDTQRVGVPKHLTERLGTVGATIDAAPKKHDILVLLRHPCAPNARTSDAFLERRFTWLLYISAAIVGDEGADRNTSFDEIDWERHRNLGEHIAAAILDASHQCSELQATEPL